MKLPRLPEESYSNFPKARVVARHENYTVGETTGGLSVLFAILCIVDLFGVFPIITLPKSIIACGIYGIPLVLSMVGIQLYTAALLGRCWLLAQEISPGIKEQNRSPYAAVANLAFGIPARRVVTFLIDATVFGSGVPNFILASQSLQIFWWKISGGDISVTYCVWMLLLGLLLCPVMWLGSPKDMKPLATMSFFIVTTVAICTWTCILMDDVTPIRTSNLMDYEPELVDFLIAYGILAFQISNAYPAFTILQIDLMKLVGNFTLFKIVFVFFCVTRTSSPPGVVKFDIHPLLLTIQVDMKNGNKINSAVLGGFGVTGLMFTVTSLLVATRYGVDVDNNILETIPPSIPLYLMALLVTLQLSLSSAVGNSALFQHIEDLLRIPRDFCTKRCLLRSSIVAIAVFLGETVPRFDLVMGLVGSTLTGPLMFVFPPLFFLRLCYLKSIKDFNTTENKSKVKSKLKTSKVTNGASNFQNGRLSFPLILNNAFQTKYKTFTSDYVIINSCTNDSYPIKWYDILLAMIVMCMGIGATVIATYSSWSNSIAYAEFSPPCLINATIAARSFIHL